MKEKASFHQKTVISDYSLTFHEFTKYIAGELPNKHSEALEILRPLVPKIFHPGYQLWRLNKKNGHQKQEEAPNSTDFDWFYRLSQAEFIQTMKQIFFYEHMMIAVLKLISVISSFLSPLILDALTVNFSWVPGKEIEHTYVSQLTSWMIGSSDPKLVGFAISLLLIANLAFGMFLETEYRWRIHKFSSQIKICFQAFIYSKILRLHGAPDKDVANPLNAIGGDIDSMTNFVISFHQTWGSVLRLIYALVMLWARMKEASSFGFGLIVILCFVNFRVTKTIGWSFDEIMKFKDQRVSLTTNILNGIKSIKYFRWEETFYQKIMAIREKEFAMITLSKYLDGFCVFFWATTSVLLTVSTFFVFSYIGYNIIEDNVFTTVGLFQMLINPLNDLPWTIGGTLGGLSSYRRIKEFWDIKDVPVDGASKKPTAQNSSALEVKCAKAFWPTQKSDQAVSFYLKQIGYVIKPAEFHLLVGKVSSGKTAFLHLLMNELEVAEPSSFSYNRNGKIAYVGQNAWLQKGSIRDNILFGKEYNEKFYLECVEACDLRQDIQRLNGGDYYDVGQDGINLSGGQRQRVSLCRALYQDADIYLLDDIFSAVDVSVGKTIFDRAISKFLLAKKKTIVLVISQYHFLHKIKEDHKILLLKNGTINTKEETIKEFIKVEETEGSKSEEQQTQSVQGSAQKETEVVANSENFQVEQNSEFFEKGEIKLEALLEYMRAGGYFWCFLMIFGAFIMEGSRVLFDLWLKDYVESAREHRPAIFFYHSFEVTLIIVGAFVVLCTALRAYWFSEGNLRCAKNLFKKLLRKVIYSELRFFDTTTVGDILLRFTGDTKTLDLQFSFEANTLIHNVVMTLGKLIIFIIQLPLLLVFMIPSVLYISNIQKRYRTFNRDVKRIDGAVGGQMITHIQETLGGLKLIRAFGKQNHMFSEFLRKLSQNTRTSIILQNASLWLQIRMQTLSLSIALITICWINYKRFYYAEAASALDVSLILLYVINLLPLFGWLVGSYTATEKELIGLERINLYLKNNTESFSADDQLDSPSKSESLKFENVVMSYDPTKPPALKGVSFECAKGKKVAICGRTGSGKSSILNCAIGLYKTEKGQILIGGSSKTLQQLKDLRKNIAIIPQFGFLFEGTVQENLDPENRFSKEDIEKNIFVIREKLESNMKLRRTNSDEKHSGLDLSKLFDLNFMISSNGSNLSNGEKQIINIVRTLLKDTEIVFLDEATSNMDPHTDALIHDLLFETCANKTMVVITHRLEYLPHYNKIILLENGAIVEEGHYKELVADGNRKFAKFISQE